MSNLYSISIIFAAILLAVALPSADAVFDESKINLTWQETGGVAAVAIDADEDGTLDGLYELDSLSGTITFTKVIGNGSSAPTLTLPAGTYHDISVHADKVYVVTHNNSGTLCSMTVNEINLTTGTATPSLFTNSFNLASGTAIAEEGKVYVYDGKVTLGAICSASTNHEMEIYNPTDGVLYSFVNVGSYADVAGTTYMGVITSTSDGAIWQDDNTIETSWEASFVNNDYDYSNCGKATSFQCSGIYNGDAYLVGAATLSGGNIIGDVFVAKGVKTFVGPYDVTTPATGLKTVNGAPDHLAQNLTKLDQITTLLSGITLGTSSITYVTHPFDDGTNKYIVSPGATDIYDYANVDALYAQDRAYITFGIEDANTNNYNTDGLFFNSQLGTYYMKGPAHNVNYNNHVGGTVTSGYFINPTSTVTKPLYPTSSDADDAIVWFDTPTTGLTEMSVLVNNSPTESAYSARGTVITNGIPHNYSEGPLTADNGFTIEVPSGVCLKIYLRDLQLLTGWEYLGDLCASGIMPKSIPYLSNLAFTFWSLEWGVDSKYNQETATFETLVRNDNPYTYYIDIYDSTDTLIDSQFYNVTGGGIDLQTYNTTGYSLPARAVYMDASNSTIYTTTIGFPGYLSAVSAQWGSLFTIDGFNMLMLIPLVFAAMFTRNSVAIGTGLTVVFIGALVWFGVLVVPEPIIYLMAFVAVIGMIAYKLR